MYAEE
jgi:hypothetical protein